MSTHIGAARGDIAETVLIAGDPLRARFVADTMLTDVRRYNEIRGMLGFTGLYKGKRVSVQGTGIGIPSTAVYVHELIHDFGVRQIIRIGTCGGLQPELQLDQLILATAAYTDSRTHLSYYPDEETPALATEALLGRARESARALGISVIEGPIFSTDMFYHDDPRRWDRWRTKGVWAVEMETSILYGMARDAGIGALTILSVSDNILTATFQTAADRQEASRPMMELALELV